MAADSAAFGQGGLNAHVDMADVVDGIELTESEISWRKDFINFTEGDEAILSDLKEEFDAHAEDVADTFYDNLTQYDQTMAVFDRSEKSIDQLKKTQVAYLKTLGGGTYDATYFENRARIGKIHDLLDMPMKLYLGQFSVYFETLLPIICNRLGGRLTATIEDDFEDDEVERMATIVDEELEKTLAEILAVWRIINLDMQVVVDSYIHSYSTELEEKTREQQALMDSIEQDLEQPIASLSQSANDVAESTVEVSDVVTDQTESIAEAASDVDHLSASIEEIATTAEAVTRKSSQSEVLAEAGHDSATDALDAMEQLEDAVHTVSSDFERLHAQMNEVNEITDVINDIAEKTNLLALNASIEAARAGDAGKGFAVVADEIKSLANQSKENAASIDSTISQVQEESDDTVESLQKAIERFEEGSTEVEKTMEYLVEIVESAQDTARGIQEVSHAADDQATTTEEVSQVIDDLVVNLEQMRGEFDEIAGANERQRQEIQELVTTAEKLASGAI